MGSAPSGVLNGAPARRLARHSAFPRATPVVVTEGCRGSERGVTSGCHWGVIGVS
jgi:hypothetical protein